MCESPDGLPIEQMRMRKPSRTMPPAPSNFTSSSWIANVGCALFVGALLVALVCTYPLIALPSLGALVIFLVVFTVDARIRNGRRFKELASERQGESICSFARAFDCGSVDTWVIRAVYDAMQPYCCEFGRNKLPLRPDDELGSMFRMDIFDFDEIAESIGRRTGRSCEELSDIVEVERIATVRDLVMYFTNAKRVAAA